MLDSWRVSTFDILRTYTMLELRPSEVFFSQATIKDHFRRGYRTIYETLEQCTNDPCTVDNIPKITVCKKDGKWFTLDNRRLWVFRQLEAKGLLSSISVFESDSIPECKYNTKNGGTSVEILQVWKPHNLPLIDNLLLMLKKKNISINRTMASLFMDHCTLNLKTFTYSFKVINDPRMIIQKACVNQRHRV